MRCRSDIDMLRSMIIFILAHSYDMQRKQQEFIHAIENNLSNTINNHIGGDAGHRQSRNGDLLTSKYK